MTDEPLDERKAAIERLEARRDFRNHLAAYVIVNLVLVGIWALAGGGYFWPIWSIGGWGIGLAFHAWSLYGERPLTEDQIQREMNRGKR